MQDCLGTFRGCAHSACPLYLFAYANLVQCPGYLRRCVRENTSRVAVAPLAGSFPEHGCSDRRSFPEHGCSDRRSFPEHGCSDNRGSSAAARSGSQLPVSSGPSTSAVNSCHGRRKDNPFAWLPEKTCQLTHLRRNEKLGVAAKTGSTTPSQAALCNLPRESQAPSHGAILACIELSKPGLLASSSLDGETGEG